MVPNLGVNYPNWVMGSFDLGNGWFFSISVLTTSFLLSINWHWKTDPTVVLINGNRHITINDYSLSFVHFNWAGNRNKWAYL